MSTLRQTIDPLDIIEDVRYPLDDLIEQLNQEPPSPEMVTIGFSVRKSASEARLYFDKIFLNPAANYTSRSNILQITPPPGDALTINLNNNRRTFDFDNNRLDIAILEAHIDRVQVNPRITQLPIIKDFNFVFINADILMYFQSLPSVPPGGDRMLYVSSAVTNFFIDDTQMGAYRTLKFSPFPSVQFSDNIQNSTGYYFGPSCPPIWKEMHMDTIIISGQSAGARGVGKDMRIPITLNDFLKAYKKAGINLGKATRTSVIKPGEVKGLTKEKIEAYRNLILGVF